MRQISICPNCCRRRNVPVVSTSPRPFPSLAGYQRSYLRPDLIAGLTVWAVMVPEALAYASIAGVPAVVGLYAAVPALILYAALGSSRHLVVGPMSATAALSAAIIAPMAGGDAAVYIALSTALAIVAGVVALLAAVARLGFVSSFISEPVLKGFIVGLALTIIVGQVPALLGVGKEPGDFFEQLIGIIGRLGEIDWPTAVVGMIGLFVVVALKRWVPLIPGSLVVVALGVAAVYVFSLDDHGVEVVGDINAGLPALGRPDGLVWTDYLDLIGPAVGVVLIGFAEGLGAAKTYAAKAGYTVDANRELAGLGAANVGSGLASGMVVNGSLSKTAVNGGAGARTQMSGLFVAALVIVTLLVLTPLFEKLPEATLAAVVIAAVIELVDTPALRALFRVWTTRLAGIYGRATRLDFLAAVAAMLGVLVFDTLPGLVIGIAVSILLLLYRSSQPNVAVLARDGRRLVDAAYNPELATIPGVRVVRVESGLYFANADHVRARIESIADGDTRVVVLDAETSPFIDVSAVQMLGDLREALARRNIDLRIARDIGQFRDVVHAVDPADRLQLYPTVADAVSDRSPGSG
ncbi:SulP family inorganic anion transporter [Gordonia terrae]|nr:SulP family inorganic anion transporter [Gordonia terrae]UPW11796.1 SulP family inorganic anion transporter [Gordonia terrae]